MAGGKWIKGLRPDTPVEDAARAVIAARFDAVRQYLPLALRDANENPAFVHKLRVATRRAGAALAVFADCLPAKQLKRAKRALRTLRLAAGDARDWDVFLAGLAERHRPGQSDVEKPATDFLIGYALGERSGAQTRLVEIVTGATVAFVTLAAGLPARTRPPKSDDAPGTFGGFAVTQLGELFMAFDADVAANPTDPVALHDLRIRGKQVRYAIELFAPCFAPPLKKVLYPLIESLQEKLGEVQDAAVGIDRLERLRERVTRAVPAEWPRLEAGIERMFWEYRATVGTGRERFARWRNEWQDATATYPITSLRLPG